jgi:dTDP-4-amino-4,6-dideoxygalactose transaminase
MHPGTSCVTITNGTVALELALRACDIGVTDEVIVPPYSFVATATAVLMNGALPVFVDIDPETYCIDPAKIESAITPRTKAIMPVHFAGGVADMDAINDIASRHNLFVIEDACQAHLAEWNGSRVGTLGDMGCFSFQASKNINCGEGGAVISKNRDLLEKCYSIHTCGRQRGGIWYQHKYLGTNARITEFQGALLLSQISRAEEQADIRQDNAEYLADKIAGEFGLSVLGKYPSVTRHAYHLFVIRYDPGKFNGLSRADFIEGLRSRGIPSKPGYVPLHKEGYLRDAFSSATFKRVYSEADIKDYFGRIDCPVTERVCTEESLWLPQNLLLGSREDMDYIISAIKEIHETS